MDKHLEWMRLKNYTARTVETRQFELQRFYQWCHARELRDIQLITKPILDRYHRFLFYYRKKDGAALSFSSQAGRISAIRGFFRWCVKQNYLLFNPAADLDLPRREHRLPKAIFTPDEINIILHQPDTTTVIGLRDRAVMEVLYGTGIRRTECAGLLVSDVDVERKALFIRQGKGKKDRFLPLGERVIYWLTRYSNEARTRLARHSDEFALFLNYRGEQMGGGGFSALAKRYITAADLGKSGACHIFRHAMATTMLDNGADLRIIQALLGHAKIESTQVYTFVSIEKLRAVYEVAHPSATLKK